ncbi:hypothetical protein K449DRAFT_467159 [Hypoxylon sp. EC38]|nr:hypothetical protein K449DRAFT_467159 [Hypoxylon sp. EC38]
MALMNLAIKQRAAFGDHLSELTTVFTPPCSVTWLLTTTKVPSQYPPFPTTGPSSCDPPSWVENISQKGFAYYSPAICPMGFSVGCTASDKRADDGFPAITSGETAMYCVPSGFTCTSDTTDFRGGVWGFMRTTSASGASVTVGPALQIRWREEDLSSLQTDPLDPAAPVIGVNPIASSTSLTAVIPTTTEAVPITPTSLPAPTTLTGIETGELPTLTVVSTETGMLSSTSFPLRSSHRDTTTSIQPINSTSSTNGGSTQSSNGAEGAASGTASSTNTAAMALSGILIVILFGFLAVAILRRYRRYRTGKIDSFLPLCMGLFIRNFVGKWGHRESSHRTPGNLPAKDLEAELGTDGPIPELGPGNPLGTKENPAELVGSGVRNSWMSQVSRIFTTKMRKEVLSA